MIVLTLDHLQVQQWDQSMEDDTPKGREPLSIKECQDYSFPWLDSDEENDDLPPKKAEQVAPPKPKGHMTAKLRAKGLEIQRAGAANVRSTKETKSSATN